MRAPAKRYLRSIGLVTEAWTEREAVEILIQEHKRYGANPTSWFGRLLWKLLGRWL